MEFTFEERMARLLSLVERLKRLNAESQFPAQESDEQDLVGLNREIYWAHVQKEKNRYEVSSSIEPEKWKSIKERSRFVLQREDRFGILLSLGGLNE